MNQTLNPFEKLLVDLVNEGVQFITVGGIACAFNGYVRATEDVDLLVKRDPENIRSLLKYLANYGQGFGKQLTEADFADEEGAVRLIEEFPIDLFVVMGGNHYEDLVKYTKTIELADVRIPYLNSDGLILLKKNSLREKDKMDVLHLSQLKK